MRDAPLKRPLAVTAGEPAGIGPDLCLHLAESTWSPSIVVIADPDVLSARAAKLGRATRIREFDTGRPEARGGEPGELCVLPVKFPNPDACGSPDPVNAPAVLAVLERAVSGCRDGLFAGLVTGPVQKSVINDAGIPFTGHTEFLAAELGVELPVMLLVSGKLRVALASTHLPLRAVPAYLTRERLHKVIDVLYADLGGKFGIPHPEILVCGLNPHAGEGGHLGREEIETIRPVIAAMQERGRNVQGPVPADTAFTPAAGAPDAVLAMYHDQGLPVLKYAGFGNAVNVTLGLPIVRTSVDHGTALGLAGSGKADAGSLLAAVALAAELVSRAQPAA